MHKYHENDELHIPKIIKCMNQNQLERCISFMDFVLKLLPYRQRHKIQSNTKFNI